jgi:hypothetical protein
MTGRRGRLTRPASAGSAWSTTRWATNGAIGYRVRRGDGGDFDFAGNQDCEQGSDRHPRVALSGALDDRRHRLGEQVLDIKIWQLGAVFRLPASTRAATASARLFDRSIPSADLHQKQPAIKRMSAPQTLIFHPPPPEPTRRLVPSQRVPKWPAPIAVDPVHAALAFDFRLNSE